MSEDTPSLGVVRQCRVAHVAEAALAEQQFVTPIDVLIGLGWLDEAKADLWRAGFVSSLDRCLRAKPIEVTEAVKALGTWALDRDLKPWVTDYGNLAFTADRDPPTERGSRIRWSATEIPGPKALPPRSKPPRVLAVERDADCRKCGAVHDLLLRDKAGGICVDCAGLGHLVFLPSGDAALTRHTTKAAPVSAVVMLPNMQRMRHERQGILTDQRTIELAAARCLADPPRPPGRGTVDEDLRRRIAEVISSEFPGCPVARADAIAFHAAVRGGGRRARGGTERSESVRRAVANSVRRVDTDYDDLSLTGLDRAEAQHRTQAQVDDVLETWRSGITPLDAQSPR